MIPHHAHCLNCNTPMQGKYCYACGQKQIEPHEHTLKYLVGQFLVSAFSFENKLLKTLWFLLPNPDFLPWNTLRVRERGIWHPSPYSSWSISFTSSIFP